AACLRFLLEENFEEGHMYVPCDELLERAGTAFTIDYHGLEAALEHLVQEEWIQIVEQAPAKPVYLKALYLAEKEITQRIRARLSLAEMRPGLEECDLLTAGVEHLAIRLSDAQLAVLQSVLTRRMVIITGGP